jgi:hypothetical protein
MIIIFWMFFFYCFVFEASKPQSAKRGHKLIMQSGTRVQK